MSTMKIYITSLFLAFFSVITPIQPLIVMSFGAIILDTYFGLWRSVKLFGWKSIRSRRLSDTITKSLLYVGGIVLIFFVEKYILIGVGKHYTSIDNLFTKGFTLFCLITEGKSINESYYSVTGFNIWNKLIAFIKRAKETSEKL